VTPRIPQGTGTAEDTAGMVLGGLGGTMLITRPDGEAARFTATAERLLAGLTTAHARA
jgi:TetR/AcrR family transcriptional repressor of nem operon